MQEVKPTVSLVRLYALRAMYLLLIIGLGSVIWPSIINPAPTTSLARTLVNAMLGTLPVLALFGLRYPLAMLPLLFFEIVWKLIWLVAFAWPAWRNGTMGGAMAETTNEILWVVLVIAVVPWPYVIAKFGLAKGDRWR